MLTINMAGHRKRLALLAIAFCSAVRLSSAAYRVGVGRADCTGPSAEIVFMGYAKSSQKGCGIHLRQFSRAYIFDDGTKKVAFVTVDACMMAHGIKREVVKRLSALYGDVYTLDNLVISGTHTHGAPGGFLQDLMYDIPNFGFVKDTHSALIEGITQSVINAHERITEAKVFINNGEVLDANINRSPASYENNPEDERQRYETNTDKTLVQLTIVNAADGKIMGAINWYAVHPTSMNNTNCLVTSDNVGYASLLLESSVNTANLPGEGDFVGAFASTNLGDVSPNLKGPKCINTGNDCDYTTSTCDGENKWCIAFGPGEDMFESTEIISTRLFNGAQELLQASNATEVTGVISFIHQFVDMPAQKIEVPDENGDPVTVSGCMPAMGYGFAAGTTDGPGEFDFKQGTQTDNPFWNVIRDFLSPPTPEDIACQHPKPILLNTGRINIPYQWQPHIVPNQILQIGNFFIVAVPGEFTTMSGRRMRENVRNRILENGGPADAQVVIAGLSNLYTNYIATPEEYKIQRYEGASTIFGPHTLPIYLKLYGDLAEHLIKSSDVEAGPSPPDFSDKLLSLVTPVLFDTSGWSRNFGDCIGQPARTVHIGDTVVATFVAGHPRNDPMQGKTFLRIERQTSDGQWTTVATDANWETRFIWRRSSFLKGSSEAEVRWQVNENVEPGTYRIRHFGNWKYIFGGIFPYEGTSRSFTVESNGL